MTFKAEFTGTESTSGVGIFAIGDLKWQIRFPDAFAFNVACAVIEAASREGKRDGVREFSARVQDWARQEEFK